MQIVTQIIQQTNTTVGFHTCLHVANCQDLPSTKYLAEEDVIPIVEPQQGFVNIVDWIRGDPVRAFNVDTLQRL